ncbi:Serine/threonine-protein kinase pkn1 [Novipirellula galeiformis]|uniref:Serine/threonine-protein kinase pkn1 n=1 Tax=Novipirellula galeiformis TaxID=2528004 RepID=A0A5C6CP15_9BACT|nr:formylglycine-generating enzyme family protein [Novipirellula galeiformis]TWU26713.1 Serine/threonine-protein kinase pkn1 [Novipirellula galeiformis]
MLSPPQTQSLLAAVVALAIAFSHHPSTANDAVLEVPDAVAKAPAEMKRYAEPIEHTELAIEMVPIKGGTFTMGTPESEADRNEDEGPQHEVTVDPFWMGKYEITWDQYDVWSEQMDQRRRQMLSIPASPRDALVDGVSKPTEPYTDMSFGMGKERYPAISMTQHAARTFCKWLSAKTGRYYRLPTEAEWEYAARAGTQTAYSFGDDPEQLDDYAWYFDNSDDAYHEVGQKKPNPWGLYDMHGNVAEWVLDQYVADFYSQNPKIKNPLAIPSTLYPRVVRGGGWDDDPDMLRCGVREGSSEEWKEQDPQLPQSIWYLTDAQGVGFRVVRPLVEPSAEEKTNKWDNTAPEQKDPVE